MRELFIRFMASITADTADQLFGAFQKATSGRYNRIHLLLATPGGSVNYGIAVYNYLRGAPFETYTYNISSIDSSGILIYCAGLRRISAPFARFLLRDVHLAAQRTFDAHQLRNLQKDLLLDGENAGRIVAVSVGKTPDVIQAAMQSHTLLDAQTARDFGLVHEIKTEILPPEAELIAIVDRRGPGQVTETLTCGNHPTNSAETIWRHS